MADETKLSAEKEQALEIDLKASLVNGKLPCPVAFKLSEKHKVSRKIIGLMANRLSIKIANCQLGCFP
jgi:hypothetical protein